MAKETFSEILIKFKDLGESAISNTGDLLKSVGKLSFAGLTVISGVVSGALATYKKNEQSTNSLNQSLINQGIYTKSLSSSYLEMARKFESQTAFSEVEIKNAQTRLQTFMGNKKISESLLKSVLDFASANGKDLDSAAQTIGKTLGGGQNALARYGIIISESATQSEKTDEVIKQLTLRFGGQSEAAIQGLGSLSKAKHSIEFIVASFGKIISPLVISLAQSMTKLAQELQNNDQLIDTFAAILNQTIGLCIAFKASLNIISKSFSGLFIGVSQSITNLLEGQFSDAFKSLQDTSDKVYETLKSEYKLSKEEINNLNAKAKKYQIDREQDELRLLKETSERKMLLQRSIVLDKEQVFSARSIQEIERERTILNLKDDRKLRNLNTRILNEQDSTKKLGLELEKRKYLNEKISEGERRRTIVLKELLVRPTRTQATELEEVLDTYRQMQNAKQRELVIIGRTAAIAAIIISGTRAAITAYRWLVGIPYIGPIIAPIVAGIIGKWTKEQVKSIANITLDNPNKSNESILETILDFDLEFILKNSSTLWEAAKEWVLEDIRHIVIPGYGGLKFLNFFLPIPFPFAEGGLVTQDHNQQSLVTPISEVRHYLGSEINVKIMGGLSGSMAEARKIAYLIDQELRV